VNKKSKYLYKIKKYAKRFKQYVIFFLVLTLVLLGTWCVPPKWTEKVVEELKAKYLVEKLEEKDG
jgi:hypothetical protein